MMGISRALRVEAQLVAVQRQAGLETQGVAGAEPDGRGARGDERVPHGRPLLGAARTARSTSARRCSRCGRCASRRRSGAPPSGSGTRKVTMLSSLRNGSGRAAGLDEAGEDVARGAALQGEHRDLAGLVGELHVRGTPPGGRSKCSQSLMRLAALTTRRYSRLAEAVEVGVVHGAAGRGGHDRVLRLQRVERRGVVGEHVLQEGARAPGPRSAKRPMCETSNRPAPPRVARCSAMMPVGYCTGISQPPKSTIRAPSATWRSWNGVLELQPSSLMTAAHSFSSAEALADGGARGCPSRRSARRTRSSPGSARPKCRRVQKLTPVCSSAARRSSS